MIFKIFIFDLCCTFWKKIFLILGSFLQMPGFPVFGTGQPTLPGFDKILEPIMKKYGDEKIIYWANLRQEPVVYVNGKPYTARDPAKYEYEMQCITMS